MNFFEHQDRARRNTRLLLFFFLLAVVVLILLTNFAVALFLWWGASSSDASADGHAILMSLFSWERFAWLSVLIATTVGMVVLVRWLQLAQGGQYVAEALGGRQVLPHTEDPLERRCLNIVEEMALAAGMPVPALYVLPGERGINAFAAGVTPADAVIAVTRGALLQLRRNELQGVVGHEFSHILNGDMRLSIRLAALLKGITFVGDVGYFLMRGGGASTRGAMRGGSTQHKGGELALLGVALLALGWLGGTMAGLIKAGISRQKEFLADASAVQFTRDAEGVAAALKVIGGYVPGTLVHGARAVELSHLFFGQVVHSLWQGFATHPPLDERIRRLDPAWNGEYTQRTPVHESDSASAAEVGVGRANLVAAAAAAAAAAGAVAASALAASADAALENHSAETDPGETTGSVPAAEEADADFARLPRELTEQATDWDLPHRLVHCSHQPLSANALVFAFLLSEEPECLERQLAIIKASEVQGLVWEVQHLRAEVAALEVRQRLPLLELCMPTLRLMSAEQYTVFRHSLLQLIRADKRTDLFEWCLFQLLRHYLDPQYRRVAPARPRFRRLARVRYPLRVVLSVMAHHGAMGQGKPEDAERAFRVAADELGFSALQLMPLAQCDVAAFSRSVNQLSDCYPLLKPRILKAMASAASADGRIRAVEREIVAAVAAVMDCPVPALMT